MNLSSSIEKILNKMNEYHFCINSLIWQFALESYYIESFNY